MSAKVIVLRVSYGNHINHCYVVYDPVTLDAVLIDPAWQLVLINHHISTLKLRVRAVLLTHHHYDHVHLANQISQQYQVPVYMSRVEAMTYDFTSPNLTMIYQAGGFNINSLNIVVIFTPGHTLGSVCYQIGEMLFTGDTLFNEGCGICSGKGADPVDMFYSLQQLKQHISDTVMIFPGHKYASNLGKTFKSLKQQNLYLQMTSVTDFCKFRMRKNQTKLFAFT